MKLTLKQILEIIEENFKKGNIKLAKKIIKKIIKEDETLKYNTDIINFQKQISSINKIKFLHIFTIAYTIVFFVCIYFLISINNNLKSDLLNQEKNLNQKIFHLTKETSSIKMNTANIFNNIKNYIAQIEENNNEVIKEMEKKIGSITTRNQELLRDQSITREDLIFKISELEQKIYSQEYYLENILSQNVDKTLNRDNYTNILLLGVHEGLTDTIMLVIINEEKKQIGLLSIPRDLYIEGRKINEIYKVYGVETLKLYINDLFGLYIDNYAIVDMQGFINIIDLFGGTQITLNRDFIDERYPTDDYSYETFHLTAGTHNLDGKTTLKYVRSRKSTSDFDRNKRQQEILLQLRNKIINEYSVTKLFELAEIINNYVHTDIDIVNAIAYFTQYKNYNIKTTLGLATNNYLYSTRNSRGSYILLFRENALENLIDFIENNY